MEIAKANLHCILKEASSWLLCKRLSSKARKVTVELPWKEKGYFFPEKIFLILSVLFLFTSWFNRRGFPLDLTLVVAPFSWTLLVDTLRVEDLKLHHHLKVVFFDGDWYLYIDFVWGREKESWIHLLKTVWA